MTDQKPFEEQARELRIRARPRPVTRINRRILMAGAGLGVLGLFAAFSVALAPPRAAGAAAPREIYNTSATRKPEGLEALPARYNEVGIAGIDYPLLGPPLGPGPFMAGFEAESEPIPALPNTRAFEGKSRPDPDEEAARARLLRDAGLAEEAARAPVFFSLGGTSASRGASPSEPAGIALPTGSELMALASSSGGAAAGLGGAMDPNLQLRKRQFLDDERPGGVRSMHSVEDPRSPWQVMAGTIIPASLVTGLNSDLPGMVIAQVTQPVHDTVTGQRLLIPQGSRLIGRYQSEISFGQDRALIVWERLIFPDGASVMMSEPAADATGHAGLSDRTDHHWDRMFAAAGLATLLGVGAELGTDRDDDIARAIRRGTSDTVNQAGQRVVDRTLGIQPTIRVRPGWPVNVLVTRDLILRPYPLGGTP
jgi:type IV secretion system protein VirB10